MNPFYLDRFTARYESMADDGPGAYDEMVQKYRQYRAARLIDLAAVASTLVVDTLNDHSLDPLALRAIQDTHPTFGATRPFGYSDSEWMGVMNAAKGKYFEYLVEDRLERGDIVGDVALPEGYHARVASKMNQPGWDMEILDENGVRSDLLQLKASEGIGHIQNAFEKYPEIVILSTSESAHQLPANSMVLDSGISEQELERIVGETADDAGGRVLEGFWNSFHPVVPLLVIAGMQGYRIAVSGQSVKSAVEVARERAKRALTAAGIGAFVKGMGGGWLSIPAAIFTGWIFDRAQNIDDLVAATKRQNLRLAQRSRYYQALLARPA